MSSVMSKSISVVDSRQSQATPGWDNKERRSIGRGARFRGFAGPSFVLVARLNSKSKKWHESLVRSAFWLSRPRWPPHDGTRRNGKCKLNEFVRLCELWIIAWLESSWITTNDDNVQNVLTAVDIDERRVANATSKTESSPPTTNANEHGRFNEHDGLATTHGRTRNK